MMQTGNIPVMLLIQPTRHLKIQIRMEIPYLFLQLDLVTRRIGTSGTVGAALTGTYGQLTLNANGSYTYVANQPAADLLDAGDIAYDYFNYTVTDTSLTDTALSPFELTVLTMMLLQSMILVL